VNLAVYITGHGYGHKTRVLEIARALVRNNPKWKIHVRAPFPLNRIIETLGFEPTSHHPVRLDLGLVQYDALRADFEKTLQQLNYYWSDQGDGIVASEAAWMKRAGIDVALSDISPRAFDACKLAKVPCYGVGNFGWDWIWRDLGSLDRRFIRFADRAAASYNHCTRLFRTVMNEPMESFPVIEDVPLIARVSGKTAPELRRTLNLPLDKKLVLLSFGGEGLSMESFPPAALYKHFTFITTDPMPDMRHPFLHLTDDQLNRCGLRYCDLVKAVDIIISKPGYSIVAECVANQTALLYSNRSLFAETPLIVEYIQRYLPYAVIGSEETLKGNWESSLVKLEGQMPFNFPPTRIDGAEVVAGRIYELATQ